VQALCTDCPPEVERQAQAILKLLGKPPANGPRPLTRADRPGTSRTHSWRAGRGASTRTDIPIVTTIPLYRSARTLPGRDGYLGRRREAATRFQMNSTTMAPKVAAIKPAPPSGRYQLVTA
jgi:hypothetical protein